MRKVLILALILFLCTLFGCGGNCGGSRQATPDSLRSMGEGIHGCPNGLCPIHKPK